MDIQELRFADVNLAAYNPRVELTPEDQEWKDIEASLSEFGQVQPLVYNKRTGNLVGGHQRIRILTHRGQTGGKFVILDLDLAAEKKLNLALNKVGGRWEPKKLQTVLGDLHLQGLDITKLGWNPLELSTILGTKPKVTRRHPDAAAPPAPVFATTNPGDLYELTGADGNKHRILCADARYHEHASKLMNGKLAKCVFTDPPNVKGDIGMVDMLTKAFVMLTAHTIARAAFYTFVPIGAEVETETSLKAAGWNRKQGLVWAKNFALSATDYHSAHEDLIYAERAGYRAEWCGPRTERTVINTEPADMEKLNKAELLALVMAIRESADVWHEKRDSGHYAHAQQKPTGLARRALTNSTMPGDVVIDCFAGTGSTMIAAELANRSAMCMEIDPGTVDVAVRRFLETFEGSLATRNGQPFALVG